MFFYMMKKYFAFRFVSVIKYLYSVYLPLSSNPRNHLEHSQCPYDDSEGSEAPDFWRQLGKSTRFSFTHTQKGVHLNFPNLGLLVFRWIDLGAQEELDGQTVIM